MPEFPAFESCCPPGLTTFFTQMLSLEDNKKRKHQLKIEIPENFKIIQQHYHSLLLLAAHRAQTKVLQSRFLLANPETLISLLDTSL